MFPVVEVVRPPVVDGDIRGSSMVRGLGRSRPGVLFTRTVHEPVGAPLTLEWELGVGGPSLRLAFRHLCRRRVPSFGLHIRLAPSRLLHRYVHLRVLRHYPVLDYQRHYD